MRNKDFWNDQKMIELYGPYISALSYIIQHGAEKTRAQLPLTLFRGIQMSLYEFRQQINEGQEMQLHGF